MSADLEKLPADEELVRTLDHPYAHVLDAIQNVLDALNLFRCRALFAEQELAKAEAELKAVRNSAEYLCRVYGGGS